MRFRAINGSAPSYLFAWLAVVWPETVFILSIVCVYTLFFFSAAFLYGALCPRSCAIEMSIIIIICADALSVNRILLECPFTSYFRKTKTKTKKKKKRYDFTVCNNVRGIMYKTNVVTSIVRLIVHSNRLVVHSK